jgi:hypothetical protein
LSEQILNIVSHMTLATCMWLEVVMGLNIRKTKLAISSYWRVFVMKYLLGMQKVKNCLLEIFCLCCMTVTNTSLEESIS